MSVTALKSGLSPPCLNSGVGIIVHGQGCRIEGNTITLSAIGIDLTDGSDNLFAKNFLQGNTTALVGDGNNIDGGSLDPALQNIIS
jgi:parallel beta-helix repeat protein